MPTSKTKSIHNSRLPLWGGIIVAALVLRLGYFFVIPSDDLFPDEKRFWCESLNLIEKGEFQCNGKWAHDMPLTAMVLAAMETLTMAGLRGGRLLMLMVSTLTVAVIGGLGRVLAQNDRGFTIAAAIAAIYPVFIFFSVRLLSETLFLLWVSVYFWQLLTQRAGSPVVRGIVLGAMHLTRPTMMYLLPIVWGWQLLFLKVKWRHVLLETALMGALVLPWGIRNQHALGAFHLATSTTGHVLWEGNNPWNETGGVSKPEWPYLDDRPRGLGELESDRWEKERAMAYVRDNPLRFMKISILRLVRFWNVWPNASEYRSWMYRIASLMSFGPVIILAIASLWIHRRRWRQTGVIWLTTVYFTAIHMITIGSLRYRLPLEPLLISLAAASLCWLLAKRTGTSRAAHDAQRRQPSGINQMSPTSHPEPGIDQCR
jgi:hypothetical protein